MTTYPILLRVVIGADEITHGEFRLTAEGLTFAGPHQGELHAVLRRFRLPEQSDEDFLRSLPHRLNGRYWAVLYDK